jgi:putative acetyltransferase
MFIREALSSELDQALSVQRAAFASDDEAALVRDLVSDKSAAPFLSLLAFHNDRAVGHVLFTRADLDPKAPLETTILAPLAVVPDFQKQGIGGKLIEHGLQILLQSGGDLVFVLGYPEYYSRHGFRPAIERGFHAPYPIPENKAAAWMVRALRPQVIGGFAGRVICADALNKPEYWRE